MIPDDTYPKMLLTTYNNINLKISRWVTSFFYLVNYLLTSKVFPGDWMRGLSGIIRGQRCLYKWWLRPRYLHNSCSLQQPRCFEVALDLTIFQIGPLSLDRCRLILKLSKLVINNTFTGVSFLCTKVLTPDFSRKFLPTKFEK